MTDDIDVSDHAVVRYLERVQGWDIEALKATIVPPEIRALAEKMGNGAYPVAGGKYKVRVQGGVVVTVITDSSTHYRPGYTTKEELIEKRKKARANE